MKTQHIGHIKIGQTIRGEPSILKKIKLTNLYKEDSDNFIDFQDTKKEGYDELNIKLPFISDVSLNFDIREMSFVKINDFYKYIAFVHDEKIYLEPYQPDFQDPINPLPTILLGDEKKWRDNLTLTTKAICYFNVLDDNGEEIGTFDFKTMSAHTIESLKNTFSLLEKVPSMILSSTVFKIKIMKKIFESEKNSEVAYLDLIMPTFNELIKSKKNEVYSLMTEEDIKFRKSMESIIIEDRVERMKNAISGEHIKKFFSDKFTIKLDVKETFEFAHLKQMTPPDKKQNNDVKNKVVKVNIKEDEIGFSDIETDKDILRKYKKSIIELKKEGIGLVLSRKIVIKFKEEALTVSKKHKYNEEALQKLINEDNIKVTQSEVIKDNKTFVSKPKTSREILKENKKEVLFLKNKGLGLIMARKLILKYGGKIALEKATEKKFNKKNIEKLI